MTTATAQSPKSEVMDLKIEGMTCAGCAATVQRAIEARPGVTTASVSVTTNRAQVEGHNLKPEELIAAIEHKGYSAELIEDIAAPAELRSEIELRQAKHERQWRFRAIVGLGVWAPLEILHWTTRSMDLVWTGWIMFAGSTFVLAVAGAGFYRSAWNAAIRRTTNMDTLIAIGATTAYVFSLVVFIAQSFGRLLEQPLYFTEAAALLGIISLGHWMEAYATAKAGSAVRELLELQPEEAEVFDEDGTTRIIPSGDVQLGDRFLIRPGARVPVDGTVCEGESEIDEAVVTGESLPVVKRTGDEVVAGSFNTTGRLVVEASVDGRHTTIARIAEMVQRAQSSKADIQRLADRVSSIFVPTVLIIALVTIIGWTIAGDFPTGVISTVTVLIISCPCALGLATPMAVMVGAGAASKRGILIKSAMALEQAGRTTHIVFDKTGTLTAGAPIVTNITPEDSWLSESELLALAASVEAPSEHPIAKAIVRAASMRQLDLYSVEQFRAIPGEGVEGVIGGRSVRVLKDENATCRIEREGKTLGTITVTDEVRPDAADAVKRLRAMGLTVTMLTGDKEAAAKAIGASLGIEESNICFEATPEMKLQFLAELPTGGVMVGDGINDAAALAQADLGIAMASGTNIAIESADVVIPGNHVSAVPETIHIARKTLRTIKQNLFFAFFYNTCAIPAAAFGLLGPYGPLIAAAAMGLSDITVIGNALRLKAGLGRLG